MILHCVGLGATVAHAILPLRGPNTVTYSREDSLRGLQANQPYGCGLYSKKDMLQKMRKPHSCSGQLAFTLEC
jgi:hypothetical protein